VLHLYHIYREAGKATISAADITDLRIDANYCGLMADSVTNVDTTAINAKAMDLIEKLQQEILNVKDNSAYLFKDGSVPMTGPMDMGENRVKNLADPVETGDSVNLGYINKNFRPITWTPTAAQVGAAPASHVSDSANPHKVTAAQVGARPDTWMPKASEVGAAPGGYGLGVGSTSKNVTAITGNGWYVTDQDTPDGEWWLCFAMVTNNGRDITVEAWNLTGTVKCKRTKRSDVWGDWEYVNPPMALGTEYRTTERHNGKVVYAKYYNAGGFTNNGYVSFPSGAVEILRYEGWFGSSKRLLPIGRYADSGATYYAYLSKEVSGDSKVLYTYQKGFTDGANTLYITAYYTKA